MSVVKLLARAAHSYDVDEVSVETGLSAPESLTVQSEKDDADINVILDRFGITGQMPQDVRPPTYQDFGPDYVFDFRSAIEAIAMAEDAFMQMPAKVRARFDNDPQQFVEFCSPLPDGSYSAERLKELRELGLAVPAKVPEPEKIQKVEVVNPAKPEVVNPAKPG